MGPDASPGVAGFHDNLRKAQGTSAEGSVRKEALQSLRLSLPMQETQLCKHPFPLLFPPSMFVSLSPLGAGALRTCCLSRCVPVPAVCHPSPMQGCAFSKGSFTLESEDAVGVQALLRSDWQRC